MGVGFCTHCKRWGHNINDCRSVVESYNLPVKIGVECTNCHARGAHYTKYCPRRQFRPRLSRWPGVPCACCRKTDNKGRNHEIHTCWNFARKHRFPVPLWWTCFFCKAVGDHGVQSCPNLGGYLMGKHGKMIVFDFETTRLRGDVEILEIAACPVDDVKNMFHTFSFPEGPITKGAAKVNNFRKFNGTLRRHRKELEAPPALMALQKFVEWLEKHGGTAPILVAHNCRTFDGPVLLHNLFRRASPEVLEKFLNLRTKFADTLPFLEEADPDGKRYKLELVYERIVGREMPKAHEAAGDVEGLVEILTTQKFRSVRFQPYVFTAQNLVDKLKNAHNQ